MPNSVNSRWFHAVHIVIAMISLCSVIPAQAQQSLAVGDSATARLTAAEPQVGFVFDGVPGSPLQIDIIAIDDSLLLQAVVLGPDSELALAISNDGTANRVRGTLQIVQSGQYSIFVNDINANPGTFIISLTGEVTCEVIIETVLRAAQDNCSETARNEVCIGAQTVSGVLRQDIQPLQFASLGDRAPVSALEALTLTSLDTDTREMGAALMQLQANLPDTLPGQNVTVLLFGGMEVTNRTTPESDLAGLYGPMKAFYFRPGIGAASCVAAPAEGVMITTPQDVGMITFNVNGADIALGSTALLTLNTATGLRVDLLEGSAVVSVEGVAQTMIEGQRLAVPVDANFEAAGPPSAPEPIPPGAPVLPIDILVPAQLGATPTVAAPGIPTVLPLTPTATPGRPPLPVTGLCVLRTAEADVSVNIRRAPGTEFGVVGSLEPEETASVIGRDQSGGWYQLSRGWVAEFVTERGGNCNGLPITYVPPTATPTPTFTPMPMTTPTSFAPTLPPVVTNCDDLTAAVTIDAAGVGIMANLQRDIDYGPDCSGSYTVRYQIVNANQFPDRDLRWNIRCTGDAAGFVEIAFSDGTSTPCSSTAYNFRSSVRRGDDFFTIRYASLPRGTGVTTVSVVMSVLD